MVRGYGGTGSGGNSGHCGGGFGGNSGNNSDCHSPLRQSNSHLLNLEKGILGHWDSETQFFKLLKQK